MVILANTLSQAKKQILHSYSVFQDIYFNTVEPLYSTPDTLGQIKELFHLLYMRFYQASCIIKLYCCIKIYPLHSNTIYKFTYLIK